MIGKEAMNAFYHQSYAYIIGLGRKMLHLAVAAVVVTSEHMLIYNTDKYNS